MQSPEGGGPPSPNFSRHRQAAGIDGTTGHGLRHEHLNDAYEGITEVPSPVRGGGPVSPELDRAARLAVSQLAGNARLGASGAYLGAIRRTSVRRGVRSNPPTGPKPGDDDAAPVEA